MDMNRQISWVLALLLVGLGHVSCQVRRGGWNIPEWLYSRAKEDMECTQITLSTDTPFFFRSPGNYPYYYPNNYDGCWRVSSAIPDTSPRLKVMYSAVEALLIYDCVVADFVEIRDGPDVNSTLLLRWCGWGHPTYTFIATNDSLYIRFHTDGSINSGGFEMKVYLNESVVDSAEAIPVDNITFPALGALPGAGLLPGPRTTQGPSGGSQQFDNDPNSRNYFDNNLRRNLLDISSGLEKGSIAAIVIAAVIGFCCLVGGIYCGTKACLKKNNTGWNAMGDVIMPNGRARNFDSFDATQPRSGGTAVSGAVGGAPRQPPSAPVATTNSTNEKYSLPGPVVAAPEYDNSNVTFANPQMTLGTTAGPGGSGGVANGGFSVDSDDVERGESRSQPAPDPVLPPPTRLPPIAPITMTTRNTAGTGDRGMAAQEAVAADVVEEEAAARRRELEEEAWSRRNMMTTTPGASVEQYDDLYAKNSTSGARSGGPTMANIDIDDYDNNFGSSDDMRAQNRPQHLPTLNRPGGALLPPLRGGASFDLGGFNLQAPSIPPPAYSSQEANPVSSRSLPPPYDGSGY